LSREQGGRKALRKLLDERFEQLASTSGDWFDLADDLHEAARILWQTRPFADPTPGPVVAPFRHLIALMLAGLALENLLKGRYVVVHGNRPYKTHDLVDLAAKAGVALDPSETRLVRRLTQFVTWSGRYPVPPSPEKNDVIVSSSSDWSDCDLLYQRLKQLSTSSTESGRQGKRT